MMQTIAIFVAAYRELSARRLFWLAIGITVVAVGLLACLGINDTGVSFLTWTLESAIFNTSTMSPETFYKKLFVSLGVEWWLGLISTLLALVTTCGIIPDLVAPGSVDLLLAKPISRSRLFLTKYASGLLFAALQVFVFSAASFVVIGLRGGAWEVSLFAAVPIVTFFYSLLFCICALVGVVTGSSVASLILTLLAWSVIFTVSFAETIVNGGRLANETEASSIEELLASTDDPPDEEEREELMTDLADSKDQQPTWDKVHWWLFGIKTCLPKTTDTLGLLDRWLIVPATLPQRDGGTPSEAERAFEFGSRRVHGKSLPEVVRGVQRSQSLWWVLGTSGIIEAGILALATFIFVRKDY